VLYRIGLRYSGGGLVLRPEAIYFVRLLQQQGRPLLPDITVLPVGPEAWQAGQPVYGEAVLGVLQAWLKTRRGRSPRPLSTCLSAKTAYFGALTLPVYQAESHAEVRLQIQQAVPLQQNLALDYQTEPQALQRRVTYVAARQSEVSAIANYFQRAGFKLAALDLDVFALWRASLTVMPHLVRRERVALLWVGQASAVFALYQKEVVVVSLAWSHDLPLSLHAFVEACANQVRAHELASWEVCAASRESADAVIAASRQAGLTPAFLDLMPYGHSHQALAHAFLAWGLALRGVTRR
jgi:Tfp pilus assembly PilM family ATPase